VVPNNSGHDAFDPILHDVRARDEFYWQVGNIHTWGLNTPVLVPTFPRYPGQYFQSLGPVAFQKHDDEALQRIDLQLMAMIEDARERLRSAGHYIYKKVFMAGFSASGSFRTVSHNPAKYAPPSPIPAKNEKSNSPIVVLYLFPARGARGSEVLSSITPDPHGHRGQSVFNHS